MSSGPTTAAAADGAPLPPSWAGRGRRGLAVALCLLVLPVWAAQAEDRPEPLRTPGSKQQYRQVVAAWEARKPDGVVALMQPRGALRLKLFARQVAGSYKSAQAAKTLKSYFAHVSAVDLKDVTDKDQRLPRGWAVRQYEYRYTQRGRDPVKTLLTITMRGDGRGTWTLSSIEETKLPVRRPRRR